MINVYVSDVKRALQGFQGISDLRTPAHLSVDPDSHITWREKDVRFWFMVYISACGGYCIKCINVDKSVFSQ